MTERKQRHPFTRSALLVCCCMPVAACTDPAEPQLLAWEGDIAPAGPGAPMGSAAVVSQYGRTEASIHVEGQPGMTFRWRIQEGTCADAGSLVGGAAVYPALTTNDSGEASEETTIAGVLDGGRDYAARVLADETDTVLACGNLHRVR